MSKYNVKPWRHIFMVLIYAGVILLSSCYPDYKRAFVNNEPVFTADIAPIIFRNCSFCHFEGGPAPFSLINYRQIADKADVMLLSMQSGYMPPWKPDPHYSSFSNEIKIGKDDIALFERWIKNFKRQGNRDTMIEYLATKSKYEVQPDDTTIVLTTTTEFIHPGNGLDQFEDFEIPLNNKDSLFIKKAEIIPQNRSIFHHAWLLLFPAGFNPKDANAFRDPEVLMHIQAIGGFLPGMTVNNLPDGYTKVIPPASKLYLHVHYAHSKKVQKDRPRIVLNLSKKKTERPVTVFVIKEDSLIQKDFLIPAGEKRELSLRYRLKEDISVISVTAHMHYRGKNFCAFAISANTGDTIRLLRINDWDFSWQNIYYYKQPVRLKKGDVVFVNALYDNTQDNVTNPVMPPVDVRRGERSLDEMLEFFMEAAKD